MKVAVLMSTYNGEKFIHEQIESILAQKGDFDLELWIRDDGSKDATISILQEYEEEKKLHWYSGENLKPARSFIDLIVHFPGYDYYAFADQDDKWLPNKLESGIRQLGGEIDTPALYCSNAELVDSLLQSLGRNVYETPPRTDLYTLSCAGGLLGCTMIFNHNLAAIIQKERMPQKMVMHDFFLAELCLAAGGKVFYDPNVTMQYRQHGNNTIGVSYGILRTIKDRLKDINTPMEPGISEQSKEILDIYFNRMEPETRQWLEKIAAYKSNVWNLSLIHI